MRRNKFANLEETSTSESKGSCDSKRPMQDSLYHIPMPHATWRSIVEGQKGDQELEDRVLRQQVSRAMEKTSHRKKGDSTDSPVWLTATRNGIAAAGWRASTAAASSEPEVGTTSSLLKKRHRIRHGQGIVSSVNSPKSGSLKSKLRLGFRCMTRTMCGVLICEPLVKINSVHTFARISVFPSLPLSPGEIARTSVNGRTCRMNRTNCRRRVTDSSAAEGRRDRARPPEKSVLSFSNPDLCS